MSINLYGIIETYNRKKGKWEKFILYQKNDEGEYREVDMFTGGRSCVDAVFGHDDFDYLNMEETEDEFSPKGRLLENVDMIIQDALMFDVKNLCCQETLDKLETYRYEENNVATAAYTLQDIHMLETLARQISPRAEGYFEQYFRHIDYIMRVVHAINYLCGPKDIRVILFGI